MIIASAYQGKKVGVFGLARTGLAAVEALVASGATVYAWDDNVERRAKVANRAANLYELDFAELDALMLAPGVPLTHPVPHPLVEKAKASATPLISDFDVFEAARSEMQEHKTVAITGTNGKSTTTTLIKHMVETCGLPTAIGGNIGTGVLALSSLEAAGVYVFEMSSFQLELTQKFKADIAVLLNITPDHLDRHGDIQGYIAAKKRLFDMQSPGGIAIIGVDDPYDVAIASELEGDVIPVSVQHHLEYGVYVRDGILVDALEGTATEVGSLAAIATLKGAHNWQNAAAAYAAGRRLGLDAEAIVNSFHSFAGLAHRQEVLTEIGGVRYVNDSKATNVDAAMRALGAFSSIYWIAGGRPKDKSFAGLRPFLGNVKKAYLLGEAADALAEDINGIVPYVDCHDLAHAIDLASEDAGVGDTILLSPACTAYDQFIDFEDRGNAFKHLVMTREGSAQ